MHRTGANCTDSKGTSHRVGLREWEEIGGEVNTSDLRSKCLDIVESFCNNRGGPEGREREKFTASQWNFILDAMAVAAERYYGMGYDEKSRQVREERERAEKKAYNEAGSNGLKERESCIVAGVPLEEYGSGWASGCIDPSRGG